MSEINGRDGAAQSSSSLSPVRSWILASSALTLCCAAWLATSPGASFAAEKDPRLAISALQSADQQAIKVSSEKFLPESDIPQGNSAYGDNRSPSLAWSNVQGAVTYMLIVDDPDAHPKMVTHWVIWNIPGSVTALSEGLPTTQTLDNPKGATQGTNSHSKIGYAGPHPPASDGAHRYHFQVFALRKSLDLPAGSTRDQVISAASGSVIAAGELVGTFKAPKNNAAAVTTKRGLTEPSSRRSQPQQHQVVLSVLLYKFEMASLQ